MAVSMGEASSTRKRKHALDIGSETAPKRRSVPTKDASNLDRQIETLEAGVTESTKNLNNITILIQMLDVKNANLGSNIQVAISLCRIFSRLLAAGYFPARKSHADDKKTSMAHAWLLKSYNDYLLRLQSMLRNGNASVQMTVLTLHMRILKEQSQHTLANIWESDAYRSLLLAIIEVDGSQDLRKAFASEYLMPYQDCCYYSSGLLADYFINSEEPRLGSAFELLSNLGTPPSPSQDTPNFWAQAKSIKKNVVTANSLKRQVDLAWRALLGARQLELSLRKSLLRECTNTILPWMVRPESLMDFLTDSYNMGGSTSLLALSGLFYLINTKSLDYPSFYPKLYSLLDEDLLHSKHRSRFFRLLDTFLSSTHLPAALIASFIKRLSRLSLFAPPAAIVAVVPYIYNLLKSHPSCTFMIHRVQHPTHTASTANLNNDPFDMSEPDPQVTHAIDSSLWELVTLQSHYHPNVASLARIISEQFTKQQYNLEDFLDHTYASMMESELRREAKKAAVVEWTIPKHILTKPVRNGEEEVESDSSTLIQQLWEFD